MYYFKKFKITTKLALLIVLVVSIISFISIKYINKRNSKMYFLNLKDNLNNSRIFAQIGLSGPLWDYDIDAIKSISKALLKNKSLVAINVFGENKLISGYHKAFINNKHTIKTLKEPYYPSEQNISIKAIKDDITFQNKKLGRFELFYTNQFVIKAIEDNNRKMSLIFFIVAITIIYALYKGISFLAINPIKDLAKTTSEIAKTNDYSLRVKSRSLDEIGALYNSFNAMIEQIEISETIRKRANEDLEKKVNERTSALTLNEKALKAMLHDLKKVNTELKDTQGQLVQSEKMASIGQLSAGVAHEINNPTSFILSNLLTLTTNIDTLFETITHLEILVKNMFIKNKNSIEEFGNQFETITTNDELLFLKEDLPHLLNESIDGAKRIQNIVKSLKNFAHPGNAGKTSTDINQEINKALNLINNEIKYTCEVIKNFGNIPDIFANPQQLEQVFINIILNASHAIGQKGTIRIKTYATDFDILIEIEDNGVGIPEDELSLIFNPFHTTKSVGKGTGLGLSIVYGIIEDHKGKIQVESKVGEGSKFTIILPISQ